MDGTDTLAGLHRWLRSALEQAGVADPAGDARVLLYGLLDLCPTALLTQGERRVSTQEITRIEAALARRRAHEPVHRILGRREFYGIDLVLSAGTLEPRPDTEILVDRLLPHARRMAQEGRAVRIADLGTGTGAILIALLAECPQATGVGVDISADALETATRNAADAGLARRFTPLLSDWFSSLSGGFDMIVSNPPYIRSDVVATLAPEVRDYDPPAALDGGADGLDAYRRIAAGAAGHLLPGGLVGLEIGFDQRESVTGVFAEAGFLLVEAARDYGGNDRVLVFRQHEE